MHEVCIKNADGTDIQRRYLSIYRIEFIKLNRNEMKTKKKFRKKKNDNVIGYSMHKVKVTLRSFEYELICPHQPVIPY